MAAKETKPASRKYRRREVSIRARFSPDGDTYHAGVATTLSADGAFIQTDVLFQAGTRLILEVPLGPDTGGPARSVARIVHVNRRAGTGVIAGIGLQLVEPPDSLRARIEKFIDAYAGPVSIGMDGRIAWPLGREPGFLSAADSRLRLLEADATGEV